MSYMTLFRYEIKQIVVQATKKSLSPYTRPGYQVSVYRTIDPLAVHFTSTVLHLYDIQNWKLS